MANNINIVIQAKDQASKPIKDVKDQLDDTSKSGSRFASAMGAAGKVAGAAIVATGAAATAAAGKFVLWNGAIRALNIEDAQAKLRGLGHDTEAVENIMDSALASVKGTAYGLDAAATAAASAVAAGVEPGKELTRYLSLAADTATIAGVSFNEMGSIFGKVQTQQKAYTQELNQLADRGIPIYQWLQEELGVTQEALRDMVSNGEIDSETYFSAIQKNIGGAALESGKTTRGAWENTKAALARVGADIAEDIMPRVRSAFGSTTEWVDEHSDDIVGAVTGVIDVFDDLAPKVGEVAKQVGDYLGPKFSDLWETVEEKLMPTLGRLWKEVIEPMIPVLGTSLVVALGLAVDAFNLALQVVTPLLNFLIDNEWIIWGFVGAWGALKAVMKFESTFESLKKGFGTLTKETIPGVKGKVNGLQTQIGKPVALAISVGAAMAALQLVIDKHNETMVLLRNLNESVGKTKKSADNTDAAMRQLAEDGKITTDQLNKYFRETRLTAEETSNQLYSGFFGPMRRSIDDLYTRLSGAKDLRAAGVGTKGRGNSSGGWASGTNYSPGDVRWVGEHGPERVYIPQGAQVEPAYRSRQPEQGATTGAPSLFIENININNETDYRKMLSDIGFALELH